MPKVTEMNTVQVNQATKPADNNEILRVGRSDARILGKLTFTLLRMLGEKLQ